MKNGHLEWHASLLCGLGLSGWRRGREGSGDGGEEGGKGEGLEERIEGGEGKMKEGGERILD